MIPQQNRLKCGAAALAALAALLTAAQAQPFAYNNNELALGFRKTGIHQEAYEAVVNIGPATNYVSLAPGATIPVPNFTAAQLDPDSFSSLDFLSWSVSGYSKTNNAFALPGYINNTLWLTAPRSSPTAQSAPPARLTFTQQGAVATQIKSIFSGAAYIASQTSAGPDNTVKFIRQPVNNSANLSTFVASIVDSSRSTLRDSWPGDIETTTPENFSGASMADLYEIRPSADAQGNPVTDPHTGQTSGDAYYVGYFTLTSNGVMTFTRASSSVVQPPSAPALSVTRTDTVTHIAFSSEKSAVYTLYYTDAAGLDKPLAAWTSQPAKITGDGTTKQFDDTTTDRARFYRVSAQ